MKKHHYEVIEFGKAKYKFDDKNSESYFVSYKTKNGSKTTVSEKRIYSCISNLET
jgi:hypothetical protein